MLTLIRSGIEKKYPFIGDAVAIAAPPLPVKPPGAIYRD
jgi:hypothetical protein